MGAETGWIVSRLGAESILVPDAGHYPQSQQPGIVADAITWFIDEEVQRGPSGTHA